MRQILHISDVHFGPPHLPELAEGVLRFAAQRQPDLVVVSGDLTQRAKPEQFRQANRFISRFQAPTLVVPGNHDVPLYRVWERFGSPFGAYRRHFADDLEPVYRDEELFVIGVNTAHGWTFKDGRISRRRLQEVGARLAAVPSNLFKVVVAHHHLIPPPWFGNQKVLRGARSAIDLLTRLGVDLVLSGHLHQSFIGNSEEFYPKGRPPLVILHSGTTTSNRGRQGERDKNTCYWIRIESESMSVSNFRWETEVGRFTEHSRHWYPRQNRSPYNLEGLNDSLPD